MFDPRKCRHYLKEISPSQTIEDADTKSMDMSIQEAKASNEIREIS